MNKPKPRGYWTLERIALEALKYTSKLAFSLGSTGAYNRAHHYGVIDDVCAHMIPTCKPDGYWHDKARCAEEALKYNTRTEFVKGCGSAYNIARKNDWLDDICGHMKIVGNRYKRGIYAVIFPDRLMAYVGLSFDPAGRLTSHRKKSSNKHVRKLISEGVQYETIIYDGWYTKKDARSAEKRHLKMLKEAGYEMLNIAKTGGLGGNDSNWTKEQCAEEASKYKTRILFYRNCRGGHHAASLNGWLDEICSHMPPPFKPIGYWDNKEHCAEAALKYNNRTDFCNGCSLGYKFSCKNGWLDDICSHMINRRKPDGYWTYERCAAEAAKYKTNLEFRRGSGSACTRATKEGWLRDICNHMPPPRKSPGYWTKERCAEVVMNATDKKEVKVKFKGAFEAIIRNDWVDEMFPK